MGGQSSAPWRKSSVQKRQPAIKNSPSLNLVSVTITPSCNSGIEPCDIRTDDLKHGSQGNDKPLSQTENLQKFSQRGSALPLESVIKTSKEMDSAMSKACEYRDCNSNDTNRDFSNNNEGQETKVGSEFSLGKGNKEAVDELDKTMKEPELHVESLGQSFEEKYKREKEYKSSSKKTSASVQSNIDISYIDDSDDDAEEVSSGYDDDFSVGLDLPVNLDNTSGNVTPIPTTGELEELSSVDDVTILEQIVQSSDHVSVQQESRATPLESLLKKPSFENHETSDSSSDSDSDDGKISPKKVHFSEIAVAPVTMCKTIMSSTPMSSVAKIVTNIMASKQEELEKALGDDSLPMCSSQNVTVRKEYIK